MNADRIYELAKEAGYKVKTYWTSDDNFKTLAQTEHYMKDEVLEKLVELIVHECADIAKHNVMNISTYSDAEFVDKQIKQHFGVKE